MPRGGRESAGAVRELLVESERKVIDTLIFGNKSVLGTWHRDGGPRNARGA